MIRRRNAAIVGTLVLCSLGFAGPARAALGNDSVEGAMPITPGATVTVDTRDAEPGLSSGEPAPSCADASHTVWYSLTLTQRARLAFSTFGSKVDTVLALYGSDLAELGCNDDDTSVGSQQSRFRSTLPAGTYLVQAGSFAAPGTTGGSVRVSIENASGDLGTGFLDPMPFNLPGTMTVDLSQVRSQGDAPGCMDGLDQAYWMSVIPTADGVAHITTAGDGDWMLAAFLPDQQQIICSDGYPNDEVSVRAEAGEELIIGVGRWGGWSSGPVTVTGELLDAVANDERDAAEVLPLRTEVAGSLARASVNLTDPEEVSWCTWGPGRTAWYTVTIPENGTYLLDVVSENYRITAAVIRFGEVVGCDGGSFQAYAGETLTIAVVDHDYGWTYGDMVNDYLLEFQRGRVVNGLVAGAVVREDLHVTAGASGLVVGGWADVDPEHGRAEVCASAVFVGGPCVSQP